MKKLGMVSLVIAMLAGVVSVTIPSAYGPGSGNSGS